MELFAYAVASVASQEEIWRALQRAYTHVGGWKSMSATRHVLGNNRV